MLDLFRGLKEQLMDELDPKKALPTHITPSTPIPLRAPGSLKFVVDILEARSAFVASPQTLDAPRSAVHENALSIVPHLHPHEVPALELGRERVYFVVQMMLE